MTNSTLPSKSKDDLAKEIAKTFKEEKRFSLYQYIFQGYSEAAIRRAYEEAQKVPDDKIKKSRSALFFYLLYKYAEK
jgi:hypothetical protein